MQPSHRTRPNDLLRRQRQQRGWSLQRVADEVRRLCERDGRHVGITAHMVGTWERGNKRPSPLYREKLCQLYGLCAEVLGLLDPTEQAIEPPVPEPEPWLDNRLVDGLLGAEGSDDEEHSTEMRRRTFLKGVAGSASAALTTSPILLLGSEPWERLTMALGRPRVMDLATVDDIEAITAGFTQLSQQVRAGSLLGPVLDHLRGITDLLRLQQPANVRSRLCTAAAHSALLAGWLLHGMGDSPSARTYWGVALDAAREGGNRPLGAYVIGSMSFLPGDVGKPGEALELVRQAQRIGERSAPPALRGWLMAREAELHASVGDKRATIDALQRAERATDQIDGDSATPWIFFNRGLLSGFAGISQVRLGAAADALPELEHADQTLSPLRPKHQAVLFTDMAAAHIKLNDLEQAADLAGKALDVARRYNAVSAAKRLRGLRRDMDPWRETTHVRDFDEKLRQATLQAAGV